MKRICKMTAVLTALMLLLGMLPSAALAAFVDPESCRHEWVLRSETPATCTSKGEKVYYCPNCDSTRTEATKKLAHDYGSWKTTREATCTQTGQKVRKCKACEHEEKKTIEKLSHSWSEWTTLEEPTDHSFGKRTRTCQRCGETQEETFGAEGTLQRGDRGQEVRDLQEGLICYGALRPGSADGSYGPATESAVKQVQTAESLTVDGIAWPETQGHLGHRFGDWEIISELSDFSAGIRQRKCERCGYLEKEEEWPSPLYRRGDKGEGVADLQQALNDKGYQAGRADGSFGGQTERAVSAFETDNGIEADGIAWPGVLNLLSAHAADNAEQDNANQPSEPAADNAEQDSADQPSEPAEEAAIALVKQCAAPADPKGFVEGEVIHYEITAINNSDKAITEIEVYDPLKGSNEDMMVEMILELAPQASYTMKFDHVTTAEDVDNGSVANTAYAVWDDDEGENEVFSNQVVVPTWRPDGVDAAAVVPTEEAAIALVKQCAAPADSNGFVEGEVIHYEITATNNSDKAVTEIEVYDPLKGSNEDMMVEMILELAPNASHTMQFDHVTTAEDVKNGSVANTAFAVWNDDEGENKVFSNQVVVPTWRPDQTIDTAVAVDKKVVDKPKNGKYYVRNETIRYEITVCNIGMKTLDEVTLFDTLAGGSGEIASITMFYPGEARVYTFSYTVGKSDVKSGEVVNRAWVEWEFERNTYERWSDPVTSPTGEPKQPAQTDCCVRTLRAADDSGRRYTLEYCKQHHAVADKVTALIDAARTDEEKLDGWRQAIQLWTTALNDEYNALLVGADTSGKAILRNERTLFFEQLSRRQDALAQAYPDNPAAVAMRISEQLMNKTAELCYEAHTAPGKRADSLAGIAEAVQAQAAAAQCARDVEATESGARYSENLCEAHRQTESAALAQISDANGSSEAWLNVRSLWQTALDSLVDARDEAERTAFAQWLSARESMLRLLYPERPEIVNEVMADTIRARVLDLCIGIK